MPQFAKQRPGAPPAWPEKPMVRIPAQNRQALALTGCRGVGAKWGEPEN